MSWKDWGFRREFLAQPANRRLLVVDEQVWLMKIARHHPLPVVVGNLLRKEVHVVAFREPLGESRVELRCR